MDWYLLLKIALFLGLYVLTLYMTFRWQRTHTNMTFQYDKKTDVGAMYLKRRPWSYVKTLRAEKVLEGVTFYYDTDGELWSIEVQGTNKEEA